MAREDIDKSAAGRGMFESELTWHARLRRRVLRVVPERLPIFLAGLIFLVELSDMLLISLLPQVSRGWIAVIDSALLIVALSPFYFFIIRPILLERKRTEEEIRLLSRQLIRAEEKIRKNLARDLHDEFGQVLTALQFGVETVCNSLTADQEKLIAKCGRLSGMIAQLGNHVRDVTAELRPTMLDNVGLVPALRCHAKQFETMHPEVTVQVRAEDDVARLSPEAEIAFYRVCQESLNNMAKHSRARHVHITLQQTSKLLTLSVRDDGIGFEAERWRDTIASPSGFGILGMRERIADLGGQFEVVSRPKKGTEVRVRLPLSGEEE